MKERVNPHRNVWDVVRRKRQNGEEVLWVQERYAMLV